MQVQLLRKILHTAADKNIGCLGVMLRLANIGVSQHLCNARHRNVVQQGERSGKGVSGNMVGQLLVDTAYSGEFLQILVYLLVATYGKQSSSGLLSTVFFKDLERNFQQRYIGYNFCFLAGFLNSNFPVIGFMKMLFRQKIGI